MGCVRLDVVRASALGRRADRARFLRRHLTFHVVRRALQVGPDEKDLEVLDAGEVVHDLERSEFFSHGDAENSKEGHTSSNAIPPATGS